MKERLLSLVLAALAVGASAAQQAPLDTADAYQTRHYLALEWPRLLWTQAIHPIGAFTVYAERTQLPRRARDWFTNQDHTFGIFPQVQLGGETGSGGGLRTFHTNLLGRGKELEAFFVYAGARGQAGEAVYRDPNLGGTAFYLTGALTYLKTRNHSATINGTFRESNVRRLQLEQFDFLSTLGWRPHAGELEEYQQNLYLELRLGFGQRRLKQRFGPPGSLFAVFPGYTTQAGRLLGLGASIPLFRLGGRLAYDDRDYQTPTSRISHPLNYVFPGRLLRHDGELYHSFRNLFYPERGGLVQAEVDLFTGEQEARFWRLMAEAQRFFTLFWRYRVLGVRARLEKVRALGEAHMVPHADLPTLGGSQRLRGYRRGFWRGEGSLLLSAEYRWPVWDTWSAFLFWDEGQVFDELGQLQADRFHTSWGLGLVLRTEKAFLLGLRLGHSRAEKALVGFSLEQEF